MDNNMVGVNSERHGSDAPLGGLERALIDRFIRGRGYEPTILSALPQQERQKLLADASIYASGKLMEVEARSHFFDELHDGRSGISTPVVDMH